MFNKAKNLLLMVAGAVIGFLSLILGIRKRKIDKLKAENKVKDVTIKAVEKAKDAENIHAEKMAEKVADASKEVEEVTKGRKSYNDLIKDWNNEDS